MPIAAWCVAAALSLSSLQIPWVKTACASPSASGTTGSAHSQFPDVSENGSRIVYYSTATNLVTNDANGSFSDVFLFERSSGQVAVVSLRADGTQPTDGDCSFPKIQGDGDGIVFLTTATDFLDADSNGAQADIIYRNLETGEVERVNVSTAGTQGSGACTGADVSSDGRFVAFSCVANNLVGGPTSPHSQVYLRDRLTGETTLLSHTPTGDPGNNSSYVNAISADGGKIVFSGFATDLTNDSSSSYRRVYVYDRESATIQLVSKSALGENPNASCGAVAISGNGAVVAFETAASNLTSPDTNQGNDVFLVTLETGNLERVSPPSASAAQGVVSESPSLSQDGRFVAFATMERYSTHVDPSTLQDIYILDRQLGKYHMASLADTTAGNNHSQAPSISGDGASVAFVSYATNLTSAVQSGDRDIFLRTAASTAAWGSLGDAFVAGHVLGLTRGRVIDSPKPSRDTLRVEGQFTYLEPNLFSTSDELQLWVSGGPQAENTDLLRVSIPASDPGWKAAAKGWLAWRSPSGTQPQILLKIHPQKRLFVLSAAKVQFSGAPQESLGVWLGLGSSCGSTMADWTAIGASGTKFRL